MTTQLIPVAPAAIGSQTVQTVDGRALHTFLEVQSHFRDWINNRIEEYGFEEGKDFRSFFSESTGGRPSKEYCLALDMAKELSMVERTAKGKQARQYFIECERIALQAHGTPQPANAHLAAQLAELLQGKVLVDVDTLSQLTRIVFALEGFLPHIVPLAKDLEKQCGQPLIADLASYRPASTPPPRAGRPSSLAAQRRFDPADPWIPAVQAYVANRQEVTLTEVLLHLAIEPNQRTKNRLSKLLQGLGWRLHVTSVQGNGCRVYRND